MLTLRTTRINLLLVATTALLFLSSCRGWDDHWNIEPQWSAKLSSLQDSESIARVKQIGLLKTSKQHIFLTLDEFNEQHPLYIDDIDTILLIFNQISRDKTVDFTCSASDSKRECYHLVAFDSTKNAAYIILYTCDDTYSSVWNYEAAGIYWIITPPKIVELLGR